MFQHVGIEPSRTISESFRYFKALALPSTKMVGNIITSKALALLKAVGRTTNVPHGKAFGKTTNVPHDKAFGKNYEGTPWYSFRGNYERTSW